jgi:autotransporter-associated beta strand protein
MIGSVAQPAGTYGAIGSGAANQLSLFNSAGMGVLNVTGQADWDPALRTATPGSGGTGYWDTNTANWFTGNADTAWPTDALAYFAGTAGTVTLSTNLNANGLTFGTAGYTLTNNGVSGLTLDGNNPTITVSSGNTTVACPIAESGVNPVTVTGPGRLTLSGANTYTGGTTINGATLSVQMIADANCAIGPSGNVTIQGGGTLSYTGAGAAATVRNIAANGAATSYLDVPAGTLTLSGQVKSGTGSTGQIYTKTGAGTLILGGSTDNSGATMAINRGQVIITKISAGTVHGLGGGVSSVASGAELQLGGSGGYGLYGTCVLSVASGGLFDLNGQNTSMSTLTNSGTGFGSGALINSAAGTTSYLTNGGSGVVLAGATTVGGVGGITLLNAVSGAGPLTYGGSATLTLGAANSFAGGLTVNFGGTVQLNSASGAGTGDVTDNGTLTLNSGSGTWTNRITGGSSSVINIPLGTGNFWILDDLSGFSGTINVTGSSGTPQLVVGNGTNYATAINGSATWNIYANGWVDFNGLQVNPARVNLYGQPISTGTWGALRLDASTQSGDVVLYGNSSIGNGNASPSTISGAIRESGGSYGFTKMGTAANQILILSGTNTYTGPTTISAGVLTIGGAGQLGSGNYATNITNNATFNYASSAAQTLSGVVSGAGNLIQGGTGTLSLSGANTFTGGTTISNGSTLSIIGSGCLGVSGAATNYAVAITNNGAFIYASSAAQTLSGVIFGTGVLTQTGPGALTLSGVNAYTGGIVITNNSTLVLPLGGSVNSASSVSIAAGATLDVSAYSAYSMLSGITLKAGGTGTAVGSTAATIKGSANSGASVTVASPLALTFAPQTFNGDATHPTLYIENISLGQLILSGSAITVNNAGASPLGAGTYSLIQVAPAGSISMGSPGVTVTGNGIIPGATATLSVSGGSVNLMVTAPSLTPVTQMTIGPGSNGKLDINYAGGAGTHFVLLQTNNISASLDTWTRLQTNTVSPGSFSITPGSDPAEFYRVKSE